MPSDLEARRTITIPPMSLWRWLCTSRAHPTVVPLLWRRPLEWKCFCWMWFCRRPLLWQNPNNWPRFGMLEAIRRWWADRKRGPITTEKLFCSGCRIGMDIHDITEYPAPDSGETDARRS